MNTKIFSAVAATAVCFFCGCGTGSQNQPTTGGNTAQTVSSSSDNTQKVVGVSDANRSVEVKQSGGNADTGKTEINDGKGNVVKVEQTKSKKDDADADDETSVVSDGRGNEVKSTTGKGKQKNVISDGRGNVVKTDSDGKSKNGIISDGKGNAVTIGPGGVVLRDRKGNKVVVPNL